LLGLRDTGRAVSQEKVMTPWASPSTDEMGETWWRRPLEAVHVLIARVRQEKGWGAHGTPYCC
jgi:hypothetical protein